MQGRRNVETLRTDGYAAAVDRAAGAGRLLVLIDPPFERADDYLQIVATLGEVRRGDPQATALVWLPLKDLETFDGFLRNLEDAIEAPLLVAETRMRPLTDPMKMNGCALVLLGAPLGMAHDLELLADWTVRTLGDGGQARTYAIGQSVRN
jgi:23S rRNA (adenine2030-N6)-methyltransferase